LGYEKQSQHLVSFCGDQLLSTSSAVSSGEGGKKGRDIHTPALNCPLEGPPPFTFFSTGADTDFFHTSSSTAPAADPAISCRDSGRRHCTQTEV